MSGGWTVVVGCEFCTKFGLGDRTEWFDVTLVDYGPAVLVPALGPLFAGHCLLISKRHYSSLCLVPAKDRAALQEAISTALTRVTDEFGPCLIFENGKNTPRVSGPGCIDHLHVHIAPIPSEVEHFLLSRDLQTRKVTATNWIDEAIQLDSYVWLAGTNGENYLADGTGLPGQFVRQVIARLTGRAQEWDYMTFPREGLVRETVARLGG